MFPYEFLTEFATELRAAASAEQPEFRRDAIRNAADLVGAQAALAKSESTIGPGQRSVVTHLDAALDVIRARRDDAADPSHIDAFNDVLKQIGVIAGGHDFHVEVIGWPVGRDALVVRASNPDQAARRAREHEGTFVVGPAWLLSPSAVLVAVTRIP
jgi:hypothetical protein